MEFNCNQSHIAELCNRSSSALSSYSPYNVKCLNKMSHISSSHQLHSQTQLPASVSPNNTRRHSYMCQILELLRFSSSKSLGMIGIEHQKSPSPSSLKTILRDDEVNEPVNCWNNDPQKSQKSPDCVCTLNKSATVGKSNTMATTTNRCIEPASDKTATNLRLSSELGCKSSKHRSSHNSRCQLLDSTSINSPVHATSKESHVQNTARLSATSSSSNCPSPCPSSLCPFLASCTTLRSTSRHSTPSSHPILSRSQWSILSSKSSSPLLSVHSLIATLKVYINSSSSLFLTLLLLCSFMLHTVDSCSSRSTPKPRPPTPTTRPNITFQTYACPEAYAKWYCLNGATCFSVRIGESILYNCECADGYMGQRCEFKDLDGSYLPSREKILVETAGIAGGVTLAVLLVVVISISYYTYLRNHMRTKSPPLLGYAHRQPSPHDTNHDTSLYGHTNYYHYSTFGPSINGAKYGSYGATSIPRAIINNQLPQHCIACMNKLKPYEVQTGHILDLEHGNSTNPFSSFNHLLMLPSDKKPVAK